MYSKFNCNISDYFYNTVINQYCTTRRKICESFQQQCENSLMLFIRQWSYRWHSFKRYVGFGWAGHRKSTRFLTLCFFLNGMR